MTAANSTKEFAAVFIFVPYRISENGKCVENSETGETVPGGCHDTHDEALAHMRALYANVKDANKMADEPTAVTKTDTPDGGEFKLFIPITKVDEAKRQVWGYASVEEPDRADEMMDYVSSKPHFQKWSEDALKRSNGLSKGNVREMHSPVAAGRVVDFSCDDNAKAFPIGAEVVDDGSWEKVKKGVLTGFSIGGKYVKRWMDNVGGRTVMRFTAKPNEVSLVDVPAVPHATFQFVKMDGTTEQREFAKADPSYAYTGTGDTGDIRVTRVTLKQNDQEFSVDVPQVRKEAVASNPDTMAKPTNATVAGAAIQQYQGSQPQTPLPIATNETPPQGAPLANAANANAEPIGTPQFSKAQMTCPHCGAEMEVEKAGTYKCAKCAKEYTVTTDGGRLALAKLDDFIAQRVKLIGIGYKKDFDVTVFTPQQYGDPVNGTFHITNLTDAVRLTKAYNDGDLKDEYTAREWAIVGRRTARLAASFDKNYRYDPRTKRIEREVKKEAATVEKNLSNMVAQMRELTTKIRSQAGDSPELDQLEAAMDVMNDSSSTMSAGVSTASTTETTPLQAAAGASATTPAAPKTTETQTAGTPATDTPVTKMDTTTHVTYPNPFELDALAKGITAAQAPAVTPLPAVMAELPPPLMGGQSFEVFSRMGDDFHIAQLADKIGRELLKGGKYALDNALEHVKSGNRYDYELFTQAWHAALRKCLNAGGFNELNKNALTQVGRQIHAMDRNEIQQRGLANDFAKGISSTTAPGYYLQMLVKLMLPVVTPLANRISQQRPRSGGNQAQWRVQLGFTALYEALALLTPEASTTLGSTTGSGLTMNELPLLFQTPYSRYAVNDGVTVEAQYAMLGYQDSLQMSIITSLVAINRIREMGLLWNNRQSLGSVGTVTVAHSGTGGGLAGNSNDKFAVTALTGIGWRNNAQGVGGKGGASQVQGESAATLSGADNLATADSVTISFAAIPGASAYNLYYVPAGVAGNARYVGTYTVNKITLTALPTSAFANTYPTSDGTPNSVGYEGVLPWCELSTIYGNNIPSKTFTDQAGAALTYVGPNRIKEWDAVLSDLMTNWQAAPSLIIGSPNSVNNAVGIVNSGTNPSYRIETRGNQGSIIGGMWMNGYVNNFALALNNVPNVVDVMAHPYLADGTFLFLSETIPYPMAQESRGWLIEQQIPLTYWPLASLTATWQYMMFLDEVLESNHPGIQAAIAGVLVS